MIDDNLSVDFLGSFTHKYRRDESFVSRQIAGEVLLVPIRQHVDDLESIYMLNETAVVAWDLFDGAHSLDEIRQAIVAEFDVDERQAGNDLLELVAHLQKMGALAEV